MDERAFFIVDRAGVIRTWSAGAEHYFGYDARSAVGRTLDLLVPEAFRRSHWAGFGAAIKRGSLKNGVDHTTAMVPIVCQNGTITPFFGRLHLLRDAREQLIGGAAVFIPNDDNDGADATSEP